jgi:diguanylate cyclase (GGDEF)-like protein
MLSLAAQLIRQKISSEGITNTHVEKSNLTTVCIRALDYVSQGMCIFDEGKRVLFTNHRYAEIYGLTPDQVTPGTHLRTVLSHIVANATFAKEAQEDLVRDHLKPMNAKGRIDCTLSDGRIIHVKWQPLEGGFWLTTHDDVTEQERLHERYTHLTRYDPLTGLPTHDEMHERLQHALAYALRGQGLALFSLDVDHFQRINDVHGRSVGDAVLNELADRLQQCARETDTVARYGGDSFAFLHTDVQNPVDVAALAERIQDSISAPCFVGGQSISTSISIGISLAPSDAVDVDQLIKNSDLALLSAKRSGRKTHRFFEPQMDSRVRERRLLEMDLRKALSAEEFSIFYQPIVDLRSSQVNCVEALIRWRKRGGEIVSPAEFIPVAEESGLIRPIGAWVLKRACSDAIHWPSAVNVSVNVSAVQFLGEKFSEVVGAALEQSGIAPQRLEIELTESIFFDAGPDITKEIYALKEMGVRIALDDFGTGFSSLSLLRTFPFDKIKIDQTFIRGIGQSRQSRAILRSVASLGMDLNIVTTAEGVETREQLAIVHREGCTEAQGYFFSPPVPEDNIRSCITTIADRMAS